MKKILLLGLVLFVFGQVFGQKKNITDAALLMKKYNPMKGIDQARQNVEKAKGFIDQAAASPETKDDYKMFLYRGQIYYALTEIAGFDKMSGKTIDDSQLEEFGKTAKESFAKVMEDPKKKWVRNMEEFFSPRLNFILMGGDKSMEKNDFFNAALMYGSGYAIKEFMGKEDTTLSKYSAYCFQMDVNNRLAKKDYDSAMVLANQIYEMLPKNISVLTTIINIHLQKGDIESSEKYLNEALAIDPENSQLYYVLGTAYMDKDNVRAEKALLKALEYNPNYSEAQYQIGAHYFNWSKAIKIEQSKIDVNDPKNAEYAEKVKNLNNNALKYLEPWIENNPDECSVYRVISNIYYELENEEKDNEYTNKFNECRKRKKNN